MTPLQNYLKIREVRMYSTAIVRGGKVTRVVNGSEMDESEFNQLFKLPESPYGIKCNPDGTRVTKN